MKSNKVKGCVSASVIYYTEGRFGPIQHSAGTRYFNDAELRANVRNYDSVARRQGAGHIVFDRDAGLAVQVSGYSYNRGAYVDVLPLEELKPYLNR
jgi:hypothetical protein